MNTTHNVHVRSIQELAKVSEAQALTLQAVIESEALLDWSQATSREIKTAVTLAQFWIANGGCWE